MGEEREATPLLRRARTLPIRTHACNAARVIEREHVDATERDAAARSYGVDRPLHRGFVAHHEDIPRNDLNRVECGHRGVPEFADLRPAAPHARSNGVFLRGSHRLQLLCTFPLA